MQHYVIYLSVTGLYFSPDTLVSSTKKTDRHDIAEILLKVALNTITLTLTLYNLYVVNIYICATITIIPE